MTAAIATQPVDVIAAVDPYDPTRPDWVEVSVLTRPDGSRDVLLVSPGGKPEFRIPADSVAALVDAVRDAAHGDLTLTGGAR